MYIILQGLAGPECQRVQAAGAFCKQPSVNLAGGTAKMDEGQTLLLCRLPPLLLLEVLTALTLRINKPPRKVYTYDIYRVKHTFPCLYKVRLA